MKRVIFLTLVLSLAAILRFFRLDTVPPIFLSSSVIPRLMTAVISIINVFLTYKLSVLFSGKVKVGLFSAFMMGILPWTLEEGRVYSTVNNGCAILLGGIFLWQKLQTKWAKISITFITIVLFFIFYPDIWFLRSIKLIPLTNIRDNLFRLLSPEMWFFSNVTFYHGGLREWGFVFISLFPLFIYGLIKSLTKKIYIILGMMGILLVVSSFSPFFPESREFFLVTPLLSLFIGKGLYEFSSKKIYLHKLMTILFMFYLVYEIAQLLHFYYTHYPLNVLESAGKIYGPF